MIANLVSLNFNEKNILPTKLSDTLIVSRPTGFRARTVTYRGVATGSVSPAFSVARDNIVWVKEVALQCPGARPTHQKNSSIPVCASENPAHCTGTYELNYIQL